MISPELWHTEQAQRRPPAPQASRSTGCQPTQPAGDPGHSGRGARTARNSGMEGEHHAWTTLPEGRRVVSARAMTPRWTTSSVVFVSPHRAHVDSRAPSGPLTPAGQLCTRRPLFVVRATSRSLPPSADRGPERGADPRGPQMARHGRHRAPGPGTRGPVDHRGRRGATAQRFLSPVQARSLIGGYGKATTHCTASPNRLRGLSSALRACGRPLRPVVEPRQGAPLAHPGSDVSGSGQHESPG
jgi:hypothetical protein